MRYSPGLLATALVLATGCGGGGEPGTRIVASVDGRAVTRAELESYLADNLGSDEGEEPLAREDLDRVKSRLFDNFIEEEMLLEEARRRGVTVGEAEIDAYLGVAGADADTDEAGGERTRRRARRNLTIQKLRSEAVGSDLKVTPAEVGAYLDAHRDELAGPGRMALRWIMAGSERDANRIRGQILRGEVSFTEAVGVFGLTPGGGQPTEVGLEDLPPEVRGAVEGLHAGDVSRPVEYNGSVYLFLVDAGAEEGIGEAELRERARRALVREESREASERLVREVRGRARIQVHRENLPFHYVPEPS
jgi:hypothetical protein